MYGFNRAMGSRQDKHDHTILPGVHFDELGNYKRLRLRVRLCRLSGMHVLLPWDKGKGMFRGYVGDDRLVGKRAIEKLIEKPCRNLELD